MVQEQVVLLLVQQQGVVVVVVVQARMQVGVVDVEASKASMLGTKLEVKMKKAESVSWAKLDIPKVVKKEEKKAEEEALLEMAKKEQVVDALDLDDLDITPQKFELSKEAKTKVDY